MQISTMKNDSFFTDSDFVTFKPDFNSDLANIKNFRFDSHILIKSQLFCILEYLNSIFNSYLIQLPLNLDLDLMKFTSHFDSSLS